MAEVVPNISDVGQGRYFRRFSESNDHFITPGGIRKQEQETNESSNEHKLEHIKCEIFVDVF